MSQTLDEILEEARVGSIYHEGLGLRETEALKQSIESLIAERERLARLDERYLEDDDGSVTYNIARIRELELQQSSESDKLK